MDHLWYFCLVLLCFHAHLFVDALWSPAGKGLTSWLSFAMSNCDVVTFPLVSWVRCGAWLYRLLILALFLPFTSLIINEQTICVQNNKILTLCTCDMHMVVLVCCLTCAKYKKPAQNRFQITYMSCDTWFPTIWHFDKCKLRRACAAFC